MNNSGITSINSGPLIIRTYTDNSPYNTYILRDYDLPISTNYVLITSSNGVLSPSDQIYVSSVSASSLSGCTFTVSTISNSIIGISTLYASTNTLRHTTASSMIGLSISSNTIVVSTLSTTSCNIINTAISTTTSVLGSNLLVDYLIGNTIYVGDTTTLASTTYQTMIETGTSISNTMSSNYLSASSISTLFYNIPNLLSYGYGASSFSTTFLSSVNTVGSTLLSNIIIGSTVNISTIAATNIFYNTLIDPLIYNGINASSIMGSTIIGSTFIGNAITYSSFIGSTLHTGQLQFTNGTFSTVNGSTISASTLNISTTSFINLYGSTFIFSTLYGSTLSGYAINGSTLISNQINVLTMTISTLHGNNGLISSIIVSTLNTSTFTGSTTLLNQTNVSLLIQSSLIGSTFLMYTLGTGSTFLSHTLLASSMIFSTLIGSTHTLSTTNCSTLFLSTLQGSSCIASSIFGSSIGLSTLLGSTFTIANAICYVMNASSLSYSSIIVSTINTSSIRYLTMYNSTMNICSIITSTANSFIIGNAKNYTNTTMGYNTLVNNTGLHNTALGYTALALNTTGSYNTGLGQQTLYYNTIGSYNTAAGSNAGFLASFTGNNNTYIGMNVYPSITTALNETVIGGTYSSGLSNNGAGSNTVTLGNTSITKTILFKNVGIGTVTPGTALDVRGSYQQTGGNMIISSLQPSASTSLFLYNDSINGFGLFLNGASRTVDGGASTMTLRNDNGTIRLQGAGGFNNANGITVLGNGNVGISSSNPQVALDITGNINVTGILSTINFNITGTLLQNGNFVAITSQWSGTNPIYYNGGNVGVNTTNPTYLLDVNGTGRYTGSLTVIGGTTISGLLTSGTISCSGNYTVGSNTITTTSITSSDNMTITGDVTVNTLQSYNSNISATTMTCRKLITYYINNHPIQQAPSFWATGDESVDGGGSLGGSIFGSISITNYPSKSMCLYVRTNRTFYYGTTLERGYGWINASDGRYKENIIPLESSLTKILQLNPVTFYLNGDINKTNLCIGLIAQEVQLILPDIISDSGAKIDEAHDFTPLAIEYNGLIPYLTKAFQEQNDIVVAQGQQISDLQVKNAVLQSEIRDIEAKIAIYQSTLQSHAVRISAIKAKRT